MNSNPRAGSSTLPYPGTTSAVVYRNRLDVSYPMLGRYLNRDHTTIVHSVETFERMKDALGKEVLGVDKLIRECKLR